MTPEEEREEKVRVGYEFHKHVAQLLLKWGFLEGQVSMRPPTPKDYSHKERLEEFGRTHYSSPDVMVINSWMDGATLQWKFGLLCGFRSRLWEDMGRSWVHVPDYQARDYARIQEEKKKVLYWTVGKGESPTNCEVRFIPVTAKWTPFIVKGAKKAGFDWDGAETLKAKDFVLHRILKGDEELKHSVAT